MAGVASVAGTSFVAALVGRRWSGCGRGRLARRNVAHRGVDLLPVRHAPPPQPHVPAALLLETIRERHDPGLGPELLERVQRGAAIVEVHEVEQRLRHQLGRREAQHALPRRVDPPEGAALVGDAQHLQRDLEELVRLVRHVAERGLHPAPRRHVSGGGNHVVARAGLDRRRAHLHREQAAVLPPVHGFVRLAGGSRRQRLQPRRDRPVPVVSLGLERLVPRGGVGGIRGVDVGGEEADQLLRRVAEHAAGRLVRVHHAGRSVEPVDAVAAAIERQHRDAQRGIRAKFVEQAVEHRVFGHARS